MSVRLTRVALPSEHGSWGFVLEPLVLGLLLAPSGAGLALAGGVLGTFLLHRPAKVVWQDRRRGKVYPRTRAALGFAVGYGALALAGLGSGLALAGWAPFVPLAAAAFPAALFVLYDLRHGGRSRVAEIAAPVATGAAAAALARAGGWGGTDAWALWGAMAVRAVPTVVYVRARLRLERSGEPVGKGPTYATHLIGLIVMGGLAAGSAVPATGVGAALLLTFRALVGLSPLRWPASAQRIGIGEIVYGALFVGLIAAGLWLP